MGKKERLDQILVDKNYFETKSKAQAVIMSGGIKVNGETITKAGYQLEFKENTVIEVKNLPYVSRGGFKIEKAIKEFNIDLTDKICLDAGASTGGFTDCMLQNGAKKVYSVDVGYGQFAWSLRNNPNVKVIERTNIKNCEFEQVYSASDEVAEFCAMDLSFISITKVLENIKKLIKDKAEIVALIKPQFEAGKDEIGKNGVVRDSKIHQKIIENIIKFSKNIKLYPKDLSFSPIKGPKGNIEYLIYLSTMEQKFNLEKVVFVVSSAFETLNN